MFGRSANRKATLTPSETSGIPDAMPVLSRGRHRNPRKGACFMEMASYLAGEQWSDHPNCTHPVLASLARCVNDALGDERRQDLATMIPEVVGLNPDDPRVAPTIMRRAALAALPIAAAERQNTMALAVITADRELARLAGATEVLSAEARLALERTPAAERWARDFATLTREARPRPDAAASVVALSVGGIAHACVDDPADVLVTLLRDAIDETRALVAQPAHVAVAAPEHLESQAAVTPSTAPAQVAQG